MSDSGCSNSKVIPYKILGLSKKEAKDMSMEEVNWGLVKKKAREAAAELRKCVKEAASSQSAVQSLRKLAAVLRYEMERWPGSQESGIAGEEREVMSKVVSTKPPKLKSPAWLAWAAAALELIDRRCQGQDGQRSRVNGIIVDSICPMADGHLRRAKKLRWEGGRKRKREEAEEQQEIDADNTNNCCLFLGGLAEGTTSSALNTELIQALPDIGHEIVGCRVRDNNETDVISFLSLKTHAGAKEVLRRLREGVSLRTAPALRTGWARPMTEGAKRRMIEFKAEEAPNEQRLFVHHGLPSVDSAELRAILCERVPQIAHLIQHVSAANLTGIVHTYTHEGAKEALYHLQDVGPLGPEAPPLYARWSIPIKPPPIKAPCAPFLRHGRCAQGAQCAFSHDVATIFGGHDKRGICHESAHPSVSPSGNMTWTRGAAARS